MLCKVGQGSAGPFGLACNGDVAQKGERPRELAVFQFCYFLLDRLRLFQQFFKFHACLFSELRRNEGGAENGAQAHLSPVNRDKRFFQVGNLGFANLNHAWAQLKTLSGLC